MFSLLLTMICRWLFYFRFIHARNKFRWCCCFLVVVKSSTIMSMEELATFVWDYINKVFCDVLWLLRMIAIWIRTLSILQLLTYMYGIQLVWDVFWDSLMFWWIVQEFDCKSSCNLLGVVYHMILLIDLIYIDLQIINTSIETNGLNRVLSCRFSILNYCGT